MAEYPKVFESDVTIATTSTSASTLSFGFNSTWVRIWNNGQLDLATNFQGNDAVAADYTLESSGVIEGALPAMAGLSFFSTTTNGNTKTARVLALG